MEVNRRTQRERSEATRGALVAAARRRWGDRGYAAVGTPEIARAAGVTRGAMYHQFASKAALFAAVAEAVEADVTDRLTAAVGASEAPPLVAAVDAWLDLAQEAEVRQVLLLDAPVVLGWDGMRDLVARYGLSLTETLLEGAQASGSIRPMPVRPLAHVLLGALQEAAFVIADDAAARPAVAEVLHALLAGLGPEAQNGGQER